MRALFCLAVMLAFLPVVPVHAQAVGAAYAVDYDRLYRLDLTSRTATLVGAAGSSGPYLISDLSGLTTTLDGDLYVASDSIKSLLRLDPSSGNATVIGKFGVVAGGDPSAPLDYGMTAACDGSLWLSSATTRQLWTVNPDSARSSLIGSTGYSITGLAVRGGQLYGLGGRGDEGLYRINTDTGSATRIGDGFGQAVPYAASASPAFNAEGEMLAIFNYVPPPPGQDAPVADWSDLARIDIETGTTQLLGDITGPDSLRGIGLRGFTLGPPQCTPIHVGNLRPTAIPASSPLMLLLQLLALTGVAVFALYRRG